MKVRMIQCMRGPNFSLDIGDTHEGTDEEMARWCAKRIAEPIKQRRQRAVKPKPERAVTDETRAKSSAD